eukprot:365440-Rhodomonas_salina.3
MVIVCSDEAIAGAPVQQLELDVHVCFLERVQKHAAEGSPHVFAQDFRLHHYRGWRKNGVELVVESKELEEKVKATLMLRMWPRRSNAL